MDKPIVSLVPGALFSEGQNSLQCFETRHCRLVFSSLHDFDEPVHTTGISIKYVASGSERYVLGDKVHHVTADNYLLYNTEHQGRVSINSSSNVNGICLTLANELMWEAAASYMAPDTTDADKDLGRFLSSDLFPEDQYNAANNYTGRAFMQIAKEASTHSLLQQDIVDSSVYYHLASCILIDQQKVFKQLQNILATKSATKKYLYQRIKRSIDFIDHSYALPIDVPSMAREACMSEFHFFRMFKQVTGKSPHQYLLQKRLEMSRPLLTNQCSVADTAFACGFADVFVFSKNFKKRFGITPGSFIKK